MKKKHLVTLAALVIAVFLIGLFLFTHKNEPLTSTPRLQQEAMPHSDLRGLPSVAAEKSAANPSDEPSPEEIEAMTTATAQITRGDKSVQELRAIDSEFSCVSVEPSEVLTIRLALRNLDANRDVRIDADNGGSLNRRIGPLVLKPALGNGALEFQYAIGSHPGKYTLLVTQGARQELFEFRVGQEPPRGQAGPPRIFKSENMQARRSGT